jgi:hypothetical protein
MAGDRAAGAQVALMRDQPQPGGHGANLFHHDRAPAMVQLRESLIEQGFDFGDAHHRLG